MEIGFSLGSNINPRKRLLMQAKNRLLLAPSTHFVAQSPIYETEPVGVADEHKDKPFLNAVVVLETSFPLEAWMAYISKLEAHLGRIRTADQNAPRPIDVDIIYAGQELRDHAELTLPHPRWAQRRFVVQPLCDVRPDLLLPDSKKTVQGVLNSLPQNEKVVLFEERW